MVLIETVLTDSCITHTTVGDRLRLEARESSLAPATGPMTRTVVEKSCDAK